MTAGCEFTLPLGLKDKDGVIHRTGFLRDATAEDELVLQELDSVRFNDRQRDLELLSRLISSLGSLSSVTAETLEDLYEADFVYLQLLFNSRNEGEQISYRCPVCGNKRDLAVSSLFANTAVDEIKERCPFRLPHGSGLKPEMGSKVRGEMAMARCRDFLTLYRDPRTRENPSWFYVGLLTRTVKKLGSERSINNSVITKLSPTDFAFLVDLFNELNNGVIRDREDLCSCGNRNRVELSLPGEV